MPVVPNTVVSKIEFFELHNPIWLAAATTIGTTTGAVNDLTTKTNNARAAYVAQQEAQTAAKTATLALKNAIDAMDFSGAGVIGQIHAKGKITPGDSVYVAAEIPAPATPSPKGPPGEVTNFKVFLGGDGALNLAWKCINPAGASGTLYQIWRSDTGPAGDFQYVGGTGKKSFVDSTGVNGATNIVYQMQAVRSSAIGPWSQFNVNFGVGGGGTVVSIERVSPTKLAA